MILVATEIVCRKLPSNYAVIAEYLESEAAEIEIMAVGTSQLKDALNPALMPVPMERWVWDLDMR